MGPPRPRSHQLLTAARPLGSRVAVIAAARAARLSQRDLLPSLPPFDLERSGGQALMERTYYDAEGQLLTGSYMDYAMPRAVEAPMFHFVNHPVPAKSNVLGVKGCGEAGCAGSLPSVMNAVVDALSVYGLRHIDMPARPERVWKAIQQAKGRR